MHQPTSPTGHRSPRFLPVLVLGALLLAAASPALARDGAMRDALLQTHASRGEVRPVEGASARLVANDAGATAAILARDLAPGNAYTLWLIVIGDPAACETRPCPASDILGRSDEVASNVTYGDGATADENGVAAFFAHLPAGPVEGGWFATPFGDPAAAEIHLVLNDHGPVIDGMEEEMLSTYRAGCRDDSLPPPFPDVAKADGTPGPNACQLYQFAVFAP